MQVAIPVTNGHQQRQRQGDLREFAQQKCSRVCSAVAAGSCLETQGEKQIWKENSRASQRCRYCTVRPHQYSGNKDGYQGCACL